VKEMTKTRKQYSKEFKLDAISLVLTGYNCTKPLREVGSARYLRGRGIAEKDKSIASPL
jgi:transposase-like protein